MIILLIQRDNAFSKWYEASLFHLPILFQCYLMLPMELIVSIAVNHVFNQLLLSFIHTSIFIS